MPFGFNFGGVTGAVNAQVAADRNPTDQDLTDSMVLVNAPGEETPPPSYTPTADSAPVRGRGRKLDFDEPGSGRCCLRTVAAMTMVVALAYLAFTICYTMGVFHFEAFIGPIGQITNVAAASTMVALSALTLGYSLRK